MSPKHRHLPWFTDVMKCIGFSYQKIFFAEKMETLDYLPLIARRRKLLKETRKLLKGAKIA